MPPRAGCGLGGVIRKGAAPAKGLSPLARYRGTTCQLRPPTPNKRRVSRGAVELALAVSGKEPHATACCARALRRAGPGLVASHKSALDRRKACLLRPALLVRCASCDLQCQTSAACHAAQSSRCSLSLGRKRSTQASCVCAPRRFSCNRLLSLKKGMRRREACLLRRALVERRASCGLQRQTSAACHAAQLRWRSLSLERKRTRKLALRARCAALVVG